jgi:hypothetical protein
MNPLILTKIAKYSFIGSLTAYLSFASKSNPQARQLFLYLLAGIVVTFLLAAIWEARDYLSAKEPTEEGLNTILSGLSSQQKPKRSYYLSAKTRLELVIALVVVIVFALIGGI